MKNLLDIYNEINQHLLEDDKPSAYFLTVLDEKYLEQNPFTLINALKTTDQSPIYHPEGSVWNHTMLVIDEAAKVRDKSNNPRVFMWAALLHDIGKPDSTKMRNGKLTSYNHDQIGADLAKNFLKFFKEKPSFIKEVTSLIRWHMQILHISKNRSDSQIKLMLKDVSIDEIALLGLCDRHGRGNVDRQKEEEMIQHFINKCKKYSENDK